MGLTIYSNGDEYHFDMSYGSFFRLRAQVATLLNEEFGKTYNSMRGFHTADEYAAIDKKLDEIADFEQLDEAILTFLYTSDCDGVINYKTCKKLYELIKDIYVGDIMCSYKYKGRDTYYVHGDEAFDAFKDFLKRCYSKHRYMRWS